MSKIKELSPQVRNMIAAGEVVERPASAVKELVENAIDAKAAHITVEAQSGGVAYLRVTDDGEGMDAADARAAFLRHATSKLSEAGELTRIQTMGFRGEALAALAAVSKVELFTRRTGASVGTALTLEAGEVTDESEAGCPEGTTLIARDLFFNTPARRKFLKKDSTEMAHILQCVQRAALSCPDVAFTLIRDGKTAWQTDGSGDVNACLYAVFGADFVRGLTPLNPCVHNDIAVSGFVSRPEAALGSRQGQHVLVNARPVVSRLVGAALEQAYRHSLPQGRCPACALYLTMPPSLFDINIHPAKLDIKFERERDVFDAVYYVVRGALEGLGRPEWSDHKKEPISEGQTAVTARRPVPSEPGTGTRPPVSAAPSRSPGQMPGREHGSPPSGPSGDTLYRIASGAESLPVPGRAWTAAGGTEADGRMSLAVKSPERTREGAFFVSQAVAGAARAAIDPVSEPLDTPSAETLPDQPSEPVPSGETETLPETAAWRYIGAALDGVLLVESEDALVLIDQHAAHERLLFNRLMDSGEALMAQALLVPLAVTPPPLDLAVLSEHMALLRAVGFELDEFGGQTLLVRAAPDGIDVSELPALLSELAERIRKGKARREEPVAEGLLHTIACKAAVKLTDRLGADEREALAAQVMNDPKVRHCPHGRPVAVTLSRKMIEKQFGRT